MKYISKIMMMVYLSAVWQTVVLGEDSRDLLPVAAQNGADTGSAENSMMHPAGEGGSWWSFMTGRETLSGDWGGYRSELEKSGIALNLSFTQVYQQNLRGALSTHRHAGRYSGRYDLDLDADLKTLFNWHGGRVYALARGGWSEGLDDSSIGSLFGVNAVALGDRAIDLWQFYFEQAFLDGRAFIRVGKIDLSCGFECSDNPGSFDGSMFANDESGQFLNGALVNNPTIPFPDPGLGIVVHVEPVEGWYISAAVSDADADVREMGFNTAFHSPDNVFSIFETGILPQLPSGKGALQGAYRIGMWYDHQPKDHLDGSGSKKDDIGFYLSFDQMILRENADDEDCQGLGLFARYGLSDSRVNEISSFWSVGAQYQGLFDGRDEDVIGFGVAQGLLSNDAGFTASNETTMELYYNAWITPWLSLSPSIQYVCNPGGDKGVDDAVVAGFRIYMSF